jgi:CheY-like chemotaxis protein
VLINLTSNAVKFTAKGEVVLRVVQQSQADGIAMLHFSVTDTGIGIAAEQQQYIFDPFAQADSSTTRHYGGTGLGLAIVAQIIALMDGKLWLDSEPGRGTTFHFTIPVRLGERAPASALCKRPGMKDAPVLVADDNPTTGAILTAMLASWDLRPLLVSDGAAAVLELQRAADAGVPYRLMLCDARLPGLDAHSLSLACARGSLPAAAVMVMLSARDAAPQLAAFEGIGIAEFLRKPIKQSELFSATLRTLQADAPAAARGANKQRPEPAASKPPKLLRVLVAEDHPINQVLVAELLRSRGHFYAIANNGLEALRMLEQGIFDAILMDGQMPEMDGYQASMEIRRREQSSGAHIHIVAVTAHAMQDDRERCLACGMDDYLAKPIEPEELYARLERPWSGQGAPAEALAPVGADVTPVIDLDGALARTRGKKSLLAQMARAFLADVPESLRQLRTAARARDPVQLERGAHRLKGAAATLSGAASAEAAMVVERLAKAQPLAAAAALNEAVDSLEMRIDELSHALATFLEKEK